MDTTITLSPIMISCWIGLLLISALFAAKKRPKTSALFAALCYQLVPAYIPSELTNPEFYIQFATVFSICASIVAIIWNKSPWFHPLFSLMVLGVTVNDYLNVYSKWPTPQWVLAYIAYGAVIALMIHSHAKHPTQKTTAKISKKCAACPYASQCEKGK